MEFKDYFPVWDQLTAEQKKKTVRAYNLPDSQEG